MMMPGIAKRVILGSAVVSLAAAVGVIGIGGVGAASGSTPATTHTLKFIAVTTTMSTPTRAGAYYEADVDVKAATKTSPSSTIAQDVLSCVANSSSATCSSALADTQGILEGSFTINFSTGTLSGTVTGGTGRFAGATGTFSGTPSGAGEAVTVTYST